MSKFRETVHLELGRLHMGEKKGAGQELGKGELGGHVQLPRMAGEQLSVPRSNTVREYLNRNRVYGHCYYPNY